MAYGTANVDNIQSSTAGTPVVFKDGGGTQIGTLCRAWVKFTGTTINGSFNVSSVTTAGTGDFTVNLTTALADTNYSIVGTAVSNIASINPAILTPKVGGTLTTSALQLQCPQYNGTLVAVTSVGVSIFR